jgi:hypothetical protein
MRAAVGYTGSFAIGCLAFKRGPRRTAFITGGATVALLDMIMPDTMKKFYDQVGLTAMMARMGLGSYVRAPGYQGVGAYVKAPSYQGVGMLPMDDALAAYNDDALASELGAYVKAPSYQGVGDYGMWGNSHLDQ